MPIRRIRTLVLAVSLVIGAGVEGSMYARSIAGTREFERYDWQSVAGLSSVASAAIAALFQRFPHDVRLADRGEPFEPTDVNSGRPTRRFVLAGHAGGKWFILYERGGRGHHLVLAVIDVSPEGARVSMAAGGVAGIHDDVRGWQVDLPRLKTALRSAHMIWMNPGDANY